MARCRRRRRRSTSRRGPRRLDEVQGVRLPPEVRQAGSGRRLRRRDLTRPTPARRRALLSLDPPRVPGVGGDRRVRGVLAGRREVCSEFGVGGRVWQACQGSDRVAFGQGRRAGVGVSRRAGRRGGRGVQAAAGSARIRASARAKSCCQGQRAGRCSVNWRALRVRRPGSVSSRRRSVRAARIVAGQSEQVSPAQQVVCHARDHSPGAVGPVCAATCAGWTLGRRGRRQAQR